MIREEFPFSDFKAGDLEPSKLEEEIRAQTELPPLSHIETVKPVDVDGTAAIVFASKKPLSAAQRATLAAVVAAHDSDVAALQLIKDQWKVVIDARTVYLHALREAVALTQREVDDGGQATKDAIDAATTIEDAVAAAGADPRPLPEPPK